MFHKLRLLDLALSSIFYSFRKQKRRGSKDLSKAREQISSEYLPAVQETWVQSLGWEDPLEKEMATHSGIFTWKIPWMEEPGGLPSMGLLRVVHD